MNNALILVAEDEPEILAIVIPYLEGAGFRTIQASDGALAYTLFQQLNPDLVLLDIRMPKRDGIEVLRDIRRISNTPIIMLTAMADDIEKISALRLGADDYILKPFNTLEVVERVKAVLRRTKGFNSEEHLVRVGILDIDSSAHAVFVCKGDDKNILSLTHTEFSLIEHMSAAPRRAYSRSELIDACLPEGEALERTIDSHISNARRKLEIAGAGGFLQNVRGVGYRLEPLL
ncbi:MAG: two-component system response regulator AdeR [Pseudomonadales bacterium]|jgi:two-component system response regulator AdeR